MIWIGIGCFIAGGLTMVLALGCLLMSREQDDAAGYDIENFH